MKKKKIIKVPEKELDMFAQQGITTIRMGNTIIKLIKKLKNQNYEKR